MIELPADAVRNRGELAAKVQLDVPRRDTPAQRTLRGGWTTRNGWPTNGAGELGMKAGPPASGRRRTCGACVATGRPRRLYGRRQTGVDVRRVPGCLPRRPRRAHRVARPRRRVRGRGRTRPSSAPRSLRTHIREPSASARVANQGIAVVAAATRSCPCVSQPCSLAACSPAAVAQARRCADAGHGAVDAAGSRDRRGHLLAVGASVRLLP